MSAESEKAAAEVAEDKAKVVAEAEKRMGTGHPTPTQEELDQLSMGAQVELEPDGGVPDPHGQGVSRSGKSLEAGKPASTQGYQTRASRPASTHPGAPPHAGGTHG